MKKDISFMRIVGFFFFLLILWQVLVWLSIWPTYIFPTPSLVISIILNGIMDKSILSAALASLYRMFLGFGIALAIGILLGLLLSQYKILVDTIGHLILGLQTLPSVCWLPLAILWFGLNDKAIIFITVIGAVCSITMAVEGGIRNVPPLYINAAKTMGAKNTNMYLSVIFPAAMPTIITGIRQGWSFAWRSLMAGELIFSTIGLGQLLQIGRELNDINQVVAIMFVIMSLGLLIERLVFAKLEISIRKKWGLLK